MLKPYAVYLKSMESGAKKKSRSINASAWRYLIDYCYIERLREGVHCLR